MAGIVSSAKNFVLDYDLSTEERTTAIRLYPRERFARGLAEHLAGADELRVVFDRGVEKNPAGYAVVRAAADRRRAGLTDPAPEAAIRGLFDLYYALVRPIDQASDEAFASGMEWAQQVVGDVTALLVPSRQVPGAVEVSDVIVDHLDSPERARPVPRSAWELLLERVEPAEAMAIGQSAVTRDEPEIARQAFQAVIQADDDGVAQLAALQLGILLQRDNDLDGAEQVYQQAISSAAPEVNQLASINLAMLLAGRGADSRAAELLTGILNGDSQKYPSNLKRRER